jgi:ribonuclease HI
VITFATDGSCIGNPGPGAYGFVVQTPQGVFPKAISVPATTVGEMEVRGLLEALLYYIEHFQDQDEALIQCDSQYVVNGYNEWMAGWEAKGWKKNKGALAHIALWKEIADAKRTVRHNVTVEWVRAHQNTRSLNDKVDALVNSSARSQQDVNGPALQGGGAGAPSHLQEIVVAAEVASTPVAQDATPAVDALIALLREARDMIDHLSRPSDTGAHELSAQISNALEKA